MLRPALPWSGGQGLGSGHRTGLLDSGLTATCKLNHSLFGSLPKLTKQDFSQQPLLKMGNSTFLQTRSLG